METWLVEDCDRRDSPHIPPLSFQILEFRRKQLTESLNTPENPLRARSPNVDAARRRNQTIGFWVRHVVIRVQKNGRASV